MNTKSLLFATLLIALSAPPALCAESSLPFSDDNASAQSKEETLYSEGTRAINDAHWAQAESIFRNLASQHGPRAEAALYWEAYAENKQGNAARALEICAELRHAYPQGNWVKECSALEIEIHGKSDDPLPPQAEQDEELKLLALNSLMQQDEARAVPIIQQILNSDKSDKLKERALFVLGQDPSPQAQALLGQVASGERNPALQRKAIQMLAVTRGKQAAETLANIYRQTTNEEVKNAILHTYLIIGTPDPLVEAARHESDPELVRTAVHTLGAMGATSQLLSSLSRQQQPRGQGGGDRWAHPRRAKGRRRAGQHRRLRAGSRTPPQGDSQPGDSGWYVLGACAGRDLQEESRSGDEEDRRPGALPRRR